ncbi:GAF and ANTAR domain-containing protein [Egicoccus sp. AB-alg2]|uniref:GAF and ANTAR domain-containing protein n=1 Tax=Egicoccus sp. AB-alg2 TaxID=3242693 RepID=UPI00359D7535
MEAAISHESDLAVQMAEISRELAGAGDVRQLSAHLCKLSVAVVPSCEHAGVSLVRGGVIETPAQSDAVPERVDRIQDETGQGPCVDAILEGEVFETDDLAAETRWPEYRRRVVEETGVRSVLSMRLFLGENDIGALNLYSTRRAAFDTEDRAVASILGAHAAVALQAMVREEQLQQALHGRDVIGQAKGILMARHGVDDDTAFQLLRGASSRLNEKLRQVARTVVEREIERR